MTSRSLILKLVQSLGSDSMEMVTFCLLGKSYQNPLINSLFGSDNLFVYHQKGERVFQKNYPQAEMVGSILEIVLAHNEALNLKKADFFYDIIDPFYRKPMSELSFSSVIALPIHQDEKVIAIILIYGKEGLALSDYSKANFKEFLEEVIKEEEKEALFTFNDSLLTELELMYVVKKVGQEIYSSKALKKISPEDLEQNYQKDIKTINGMEVIIYKENKNVISSSIQIIDDIVKSNPLSMLGVKQKNKNRRFEDFYDALKKEIEEFFQEVPNFYKYDDQAIFLGFSDLIDKRLIKGFSNSHPEYIVNFIRVTKEIPTKQNLVKVASYLMEHLDETFDYENYLNYRKKQEENSYYESLMLTSKAKLAFHPLENSKNGDILGYLPSFVFQNLELFGHQILNEELSIAYNERMLSTLMKIKEWPGIVMITLLGKQLLNEEIIELVLKLDQKGEHKLAIHLTGVDSIDRDILIKKIKKFQKKEVLMLAGEDLFANFNLFELMDYFKGIVIDHPLLTRVKAGDYDLVTLVINYYLQQYKLVIFRDLSLEDKKMITPHQNVYWEK